ncbi:MAG: L-aspartate oxidase [Firmicutes bacterium]|nr:L-aspartate oxidase [Bacillota bacterium]
MRQVENKVENVPCNLGHKRYDVIIIGSGIAGMTAALSMDSKLKVALVSKGSISESSTYKAQGGIAVAIGDDDSIEEHYEDTLRVGRGLCREDAAGILVKEGPDALQFLLSCGAIFSRNDKGMILTREAGHSHRRIVHYYDYTGKYITELVADKVCGAGHIECLDHSFLMDLVIKEGRCCGCLVMHQEQPVFLEAAVVVVATGGYSGLFARSTNSSATGDGLAAAYRAGAVITDMEFVQFHPTAFTTMSGEVFLLTEALRGEGAFLLNSEGQRFMPAYHPSGELAPRDEVARAIMQEAIQSGGRPIYLDARHMGGKEYLARRFRQVYGKLAQNHYFLERDIVPVAPAAHFTIGGIQTDLWGRTNVPGLYACGEAAATGVHGANRLASNSLLEGVVFGRRLAADINDNLPVKKNRGAAITLSDMPVYSGDVKVLQEKMETVAGAMRQGGALGTLLKWVREQKEYRRHPFAASAYHTINAYQLAELLLEAALLRQESRGGHFRLDFPEKNDEKFCKHIVHQWGKRAAV